MELAMNAGIGRTTTDPPTINEVLPQNARVLTQEFKYSPGFQVAMGPKHDAEAVKLYMYRSQHISR